MQALATFFPVLVLFSTLALVVFAIRLDQRLSRGSQSPGPRQIIRPKQAGLRQTPWELTALDNQAKARPGDLARHDLIQTVNRLTSAAGIHDPAYMLTADANDYMIAGVIELLERRLELTPGLPPGPQPGPGPGLEPGPGPQHFEPTDRLGSPNR